MNEGLGRLIPDMQYSPDQGPAEFREVQARLSAWARQQPVPAGLEDRVFDASVGRLPVRRVRVARPQRVTAFPAWARLGGRLALAASIALAFFAAARVMPPARRLLTRNVEMVLLEYAGGDAGFLDPRFAQVEQILMTRDMTFGDLTSELAQVARDLEM